MHISSYLQTKLETCQEFSDFIDSGLNIKGIIENTSFNKSPLRITFLTRLNLLWSHLAVLNKKLLDEPLYLKQIRLQMAIGLMEEQYLLMSTISHLFLALQITS